MADKKVEKYLAGMKATINQKLITTFWWQPNISKVVKDGLEQLKNTLSVFIVMKSLWHLSIQTIHQRTVS